ncbi:hypothetical protein [Bradyrhizobium elkanii]|uniref:hypothetical protein n=1 Tax=Bradyrhizobium elkanii TaxID=29448 RepID=UPI0004B837B8|nr:hypothetical protein [Bradyrhizobium elkanii]WLA83211.1 hypothetical protein QNJ99_02385 [Bradyrhizobium elkanii]
MTSIFSKTLVAASFFVFAVGAAEARGFLEQAVIDAGNGIKAVGNVIVPPKPAPSEPNKGPSSPMGPCTVAPGACEAPPK